jgi:NAD(P)-dependent dehydrogenase (short-subunit alcohol dehydrogenase family)
MTDPHSVVITGASTGIGKACALHMTRLGWRVFAGVRRAADGAALQDAAPGALTPVRLEVTDGASIAWPPRRSQARWATPAARARQQRRHRVAGPLEQSRSTNCAACSRPTSPGRSP